MFIITQLVHAVSIIRAYFCVSLSIALSLSVGKPKDFFTGRPRINSLGLIFYPGRKLPTVSHFPLQHFKRTHRERAKRRTICKEKSMQRRSIYICPAQRPIACTNYRFRLKSNRSNRAPLILRKNSGKHFVFNLWELFLYLGRWLGIRSIFILEYFFSNTYPTQCFLQHGSLVQFHQTCIYRGLIKHYLFYYTLSNVALS